MLFVLLLEQDIIKKRQVDENKIKSNAGKNNREYKVETICNSAIYIKKPVNNLSKF